MNRFRWILAVCAIIFFGVGCQPAVPKNATEGKDVGVALVLQARDVSGPEISTSDPLSLRTFASVLAPTFRDENGTYPGKKNGEFIILHLGESGTVEKDHALFRALPQLLDVSEGDIGDWHLIAAREKNRWVVRATAEDPEQKGRMYHGVECLAAPDSDRSFWEGCKTMITNARISIIPGDALTH